jgi:hypothetical protein
MGLATATRGLVAVPDCQRCKAGRSTGRHDHRKWRIQTTSGYLVGDLGAARAEALSAAAALGRLKIDWADPRLATTVSDRIRQIVSATLARWGISRAA